MSEKNYGNSSIRTLKDEEQVRQKPAVIFGTNDEYGCANAIYEIIANSIDEAREGFGKKIKVSIFKDGSVEVADDGRGVPMDWNSAENKYNWELIFCTLFASGKYTEGIYGSSLGTNGLGASATQFASEYMEVKSKRDGKLYVMNFKKGKPVGELQVTDTNSEETGTTIRFKPDPEVFINIKQNLLPPEYYINVLRRQAMLLDGLEIIFYHEELEKEIKLRYDKGIISFLEDATPKPLISKPVLFEGYKVGTDDEEMYPDTYRFDMRFAFTFSREEQLVEIYHNGGSLIDGGATYDGMRTALVKAFEDHMKDNGKLNKSDKLHIKDIECIILAIGDTKAPGHRTFYKNQTKTAINNPFMKKAYTEFVYRNMRKWIETDSQSDKILTEIITNKEAREAADRVTKKVVQSLSKGITGIGNKPDKFVDCKSKDAYEREIFIVEGDSALGSCKLSRNAQFQAIMPIRGKILNCLKKDLTDILSNEVIVDLLRVLGCGIEVKSKFIEGLPKFDINKLNWGKIIICTDADLDGMQIRCLVLAMIYRLVPTLLKKGKVYIAETPLFEITYGRGSNEATHFAYSEEEKEQILGDLYKMGAKDSQIKIQRSKGLGENEPEMMSISTMAPETRRLIPIEYPSDDNKVAMFFNALLGNDIEMRKMLITEYFAMTETSID